VAPFVREPLMPFTRSEHIVKHGKIEPQYGKHTKRHLSSEITEDGKYDAQEEQQQQQQA
jgi:hypothetical protein